LWPKLVVLAAVVLAIHLWLLGGWQRVVAPVHRATPVVTRTVTAASAPASLAASAPSNAVAVAPAPAAAPNPPPKVAPAQPAPRKPPTPRASQAHAPASEPASPAAVAGSAPASLVAAARPVRSAGAEAAAAFSVAPSARYHYEVLAQSKGFTIKGQAELDWRVANGEYEARMSMSSPVPFIKPRVQRSTGLVTEQGLAPLRFSDKVRSEEAAHFDREQGKVIFSTNKPEASLEPGAQDRLSIVMQLGAMLAGKPSKFPAGTQITMQTASTKEAEPWTFTVEGPETLDLPGGRTKAVRLTRNPRKEYDVKVELWLAPGAAYAPVRLRLTQPNGDWVDQQWSSTDRG
jgi:hypothetical protein